MDQYKQYFNKILKQAVIYCLFFIVFVGSPTPAYSAIKKINFIMRQHDSVIGFSESSKSTGRDGSVTIREKIYSPYDFFPSVSQIEVSYNPALISLISFNKTTTFQGNSESSSLWKNGEKYAYLLDFGRIFYFDDNITLADGAFTLDEGSPALFYEFINANASKIPKTEPLKIRYTAPASDPEICEGTLKYDEDSGGTLIRFSGDFEAFAKVENRVIKEIRFPQSGISYTPVEYMPRITDIVNLPANFDAETDVPAAEPYELKSLSYKNIPVSFKGVDDTNICGTLSMPVGDGPFPAAVLISGSGPHDRSGGGLMTSIADKLATSGIAVLRYDKRGVGDSCGSYRTALFNDFVIDADAAVNFAAGFKGIDSGNICIIGHSEGALIALRVALDNRYISSMILMAPPSVRMFPSMAMEQAELFSKYGSWSKSSIDRNKKSINLIDEYLQAGRLWLDFYGKRLYLGIVDSYFKSPDPLDTISRIRVPVLILHGSSDLIVPSHHGVKLASELQGSGNNDAQLIVFENTGHFFGRFIKPDPSTPYREHIEANEDVLEKILSWIRGVNN